MDADGSGIGARYDIGAPTIIPHREGEPPRRNKRRARQPFDKRTQTGRRAAMLTRHFLGKLGEAGGDPALAAAARRAAELVALSEALTAKALRGEPVSIDDTIRCARAADMAVRRLHLDRHEARPPSLGDLLGNGNGNGSAS
jgi:hypothetical protein